MRAARHNAFIVSRVSTVRCEGQVDTNRFSGIKPVVTKSDRRGISPLWAVADGFGSDHSNKVSRMTSSVFIHDESSPVVGGNSYGW